MSTSKESDLIMAVLMYAMRCLAEGDQLALRAMNFGPKEMDALKAMNLSDLHRADALRAHCLLINLNRDVFWPMMDHLRHQRESEELQQTLIAADAPQEMMHSLFGLGSREYSRWRRLLTVAPAVGRPPELAEPDTHRLWYVWRERVEACEEDAVLTGEDYLALHQETHIGLRAIWVMSQRWYEFGDLDQSKLLDRATEHVG